ncbi:MAG: hypothetical protein HDR47_05505 [Bacteroides sp.]|nr:hypothetical protein [Bacteroides sp.]
MDSKEILDSIDEFFRTADEAALAEARAAISVEIEDDISIEEYISGINEEYFYTQGDESNCYISESMPLKADVTKYNEFEFEGASSEYGKTDLNITFNLESSNNGKVIKMVKKAS